MKVIISGASGLLGCEIADVFQDARHDVIRLLGRNDLNLLDIDNVVDFFKKEKPEMVIHCAGYRDLDTIELNEYEGYQSNTLCTKHVALACRLCDCPIMYISSDTVFSGEKNRDYHEYDFPSPINIYGKSKYMAELEVKSHTNKFFIIRTGLLFGFKGHRENNFIYKCVDTIKNNEKLYASDKQFTSVSYTLDVALALLKIAETNFYGIYHVVNSQGASRLEVNREIARLCNLDENMVVADVKDRPAARSEKLVLTSIALKETFGLQLSDWKLALSRCIDKMDDLKN